MPFCGSKLTYLRFAERNFYPLFFLLFFINEIRGCLWEFLAWEYCDSRQKYGPTEVAQEGGGTETQFSHQKVDNVSQSQM